MTNFLDWKYIDNASVCKLEDNCDEVDVRRILFNVFGANSYPLEKQEILVNFHFQNYAFCKKSAFDARQISTLMSIMNEIFLEDARSSTLTNNSKLSFKRFQNYLLKHSVERPPKSVQIFQSTDVESIVDFALNSYFRNYNLYSYIFGVQTLLTIRQIGAGGIELPYVPMPLSEGKPDPHRKAEEGTSSAETPPQE